MENTVSRMSGFSLHFVPFGTRPTLAIIEQFNTEKVSWRGNIIQKR